jgi:hypothetical protein
MTGAGWAQIVIFVVVLTALTPPLGGYMARIYGGQAVALTSVLGPVERLLYRLLRVTANEEQDWRQYALAAGVQPGELARPVRGAAHAGHPPVQPAGLLVRSLGSLPQHRVVVREQHDRPDPPRSDDSPRHPRDARRRTARRQPAGQGAALRDGRVGAVRGRGHGQRRWGREQRRRGVHRARERGGDVEHHDRRGDLRRSRLGSVRNAAAGRARRESLYAYLSQANNNGSALAGYTGFIQPNPGNVGSHGIAFADIAGGVVMTLGRFVPILFVLALAGSLAPGRVTPAGLGTCAPTHPRSSSS